MGQSRGAVVGWWRRWFEHGDLGTVPSASLAGRLGTRAREPGERDLLAGARRGCWPWRSGGSLVWCGLIRLDCIGWAGGARLGAVGAGGELVRFGVEEAAKGPRAGAGENYASGWAGDLVWLDWETMVDKVISSVPPPTAARRAAAEGARRRLELRRAAAAGRCLAPGGGEDRRPITERILDAQPCVSDAGRRGRPVRLVPAPRTR